MSHFKRSQLKYVKKTYRVRNWHEYEAGLRERSSLTVWISLHDGKLANWDAPKPKKRKPGRQRKYSNHAIETAVTLGTVLASASATTRQRNRNIREQARLGKRKWHTESGYSKRSKVETTFYRYKIILGPAMRARGLASQRVEARIGCKILNTMTEMGMPCSEMLG